MHGGSAVSGDALASRDSTEQGFFPHVQTTKIPSSLPPTLYYFSISTVSSQGMSAGQNCILSYFHIASDQVKLNIVTLPRNYSLTQT